MNGLISLGSLSPQPVSREILAVNEFSREYGLVLTEEEAKELSETRAAALTENERIETGSRVVTEIIKKFCASRYITPANYPSVLNEITYYFYYIKTEVDDAVGDDELIDELFKRFEYFCRGDIDLLVGKELEKIIRKINAGKNYAAWYAEEDAMAEALGAARETPDNLLDDDSRAGDAEEYESVLDEWAEEERAPLDVFDDFAGEAAGSPMDDELLYDQVGDESTEDEELTGSPLEVEIGGTAASLSVGAGWDALPEDDGDEEDDGMLDSLDALFDRMAEADSAGEGKDHE